MMQKRKFRSFLSGRQRNFDVKFQYFQNWKKASNLCLTHKIACTNFF